MKNRQSGKAVADGAVCTALTVILLMMAQYLPIFSAAAVLVGGIPTVFLSVRVGFRYAPISALASVLVLGIVTGNFLTAVLLGTVNLLPGLAVGYAISHRKSFGKTVILSGGAMLAGLMLEVLALNLLSGENGVVGIIDETIAAAQRMMEELTRQTGLAEQETFASLTENMGQMFAQARELMLLYLPSMLIAASAAMGYGAVAISVFMLRRIQKMRVPYRPFSQIYAPKAVCYLSVLFSVMTVFLDGSDVYTAALRNLAFLNDCFIGICGLSVIDSMLGRKVTSGYARGGIYAAVLVIAYPLIGVLAEGLVLLGLADGLFQLRKGRKVGERHGENK